MIPEKEKNFLFLLEKHKGILLKVARMYMSTEEGQKDLQQEIIFRLWRSYDSFEGKSAFSTWMYRVAINTAITFFRKEKKWNETFFQRNVVEQPVTEYDGTPDRQMELFYKAVHQLKPIEKAIILYLLEGLSYKELVKTWVSAKEMPALNQ